METEGEAGNDLISEIKIEEGEIHVDFIKIEESDFFSPESMTGTGIEVKPEVDPDLIEEFKEIEQKSRIKQEPGIVYEFEITEIIEEEPSDVPDSLGPEPEQSKSPDKRFVCIYCKKKFVNKQNLQGHLRIVHRGFPYDYSGGIIHCRFCQEVCDDFETLKKHALENHPKPPTDLKYECAHCGRREADLSNLRRHMVKHSKERPFQCVICLKTFKYLKCRNIHQKTFHVTEKLVQCPECPKTFKTPKDLYGHRPVHSVVRNFKCTECGKSFKTKPDLRSHSLTHSDAKFPCKVCGKMFKFTSSRREHLKNIHKLHNPQKPPEQVKSYDCSICSKSFKKQWYLKSHALTHTAEKPFKCEICPTEDEKEKSFRSKGALQYHMQSCHSSVTISCPICSKTFTATCSLKKHMRNVHSDKNTKKLRKCTICQKDFKRPYLLKAHMTKIH